MGDNLLTADKSILCTECGKEFIFCVGEQGFFMKRGLSEPRRCSECRKRPRVLTPSATEGGIVKWFDSGKGLGFITPDAARPDGRDYFIHHKDIIARGRRFLVEGQRVTFTPHEHERGPRAVNVSVIDVPVAIEPLQSVEAV